MAPEATELNGDDYTHDFMGLRSRQSAPNERLRDKVIIVVGAVAGIGGSLSGPLTPAAVR